MGNKIATFTEEQLEDYQDCTFFTRKEILRYLCMQSARKLGRYGSICQTAAKCYVLVNVGSKRNLFQVRTALLAGFKQWHRLTREDPQPGNSTNYETLGIHRRIYKRFREMGNPGVVPRSMTPLQASTLRIPLSCLTRIPELKENPFRQRISEVFTRRPSSGQSSSAEGICFEEFLEMMSVFSEQAPRDLKVFYAFKIYDFDEDGVLGMGDLERTCRQLVQDDLNADEVATVCRKVLEESDIDGDGVLSYLEFEHVVTRASDFMATFHIRI